MSRDYGRVRTLFWEDEKLKPLSAQTKFIALYLLASPHTNAVGCFRLPMPYACHDTGLTVQALEKCLEELERVGFVQRDEGTSFVWLPNYLHHNAPENPNVWRKCSKELRAIPVGTVGAVDIANWLLEYGSTDRMEKLPETEIEELRGYRDGFGMVSKRNLPNLTNPEPIHNQTNPVADAKECEDEDRGFKDFYQAFPKRVGRGQALRAYKAALKKAAASALLEGARIYAASVAGKDPQYVAMPATWLNGERWLDEIVAPDGGNVVAIDWSAFNTPEERDAQEKRKLGNG